MKELRLGRNNGFTLVEMMVSIGIGMAVIAAVTTTFMSQTKIYNAQEQVNEMEQNARGALDVITRELKMAGYKTNTGPVTGLSASGVNLDSTKLVIETDLNDDNSIDSTAGSQERISYTYNSSTQQITRRLGSGTSDVFADNITAFNFTYLKSDGSTATLASEIRQVAVEVTARTAAPDPNYTANGGYRTYQVSATITPPNLAY
jgi:type IV pilus assembly protein PilW